ncbi:hypothetical protein AB0E25_17360 [Streptomyces bobili]|uniref:hypothetical protein n=1 Tax=Streptomyces bobili TaxID=67280 RepID=UPI0033F1305C
MSYSSTFGTEPDGDRRHPPWAARAEPGRWPKLEAALAAVNRDLTATLPGQDALVLMRTPSWEPEPPSAVAGEQTCVAEDEIYVAMPDGRWHGNAVNACDLEEGEPQDAMTVLTMVADAAQATVMELCRQVWPVCRVHKIGLHPRPAGTTADWYGEETDSTGPPVWWCRGGGGEECHDVSLVGELAATLPGKQRRALRRGDRKRGGHG